MRILARGQAELFEFMDTGIKPMTITNPPKAFIALIGLICLTVLLAVGAIDKATGTGMIGTILGYAVGNGIAARQGVPVDPIIGHKDK